MANTPSNMLELGTKAPFFELPNPSQSNEMQSLEDLKGEKATLVIFMCNHCPFVLHVIDKLAEFQVERKFDFPYLYDESQAIAKAYNAACTPDFFLFDEKLDLIYRGQMDDSRPGNTKEITGEDLIIAFENLLAGEPQEEMQLPSMGCNIKWKK